MLRKMATKELSDKRKNQLIKFFSVTTGLDTVTSRQWLNENEWKVDVALTKFEAVRYGQNEVKSDNATSNATSDASTNEHGKQTKKSMERQTGITTFANTKLSESHTVDPGLCDKEQTSRDAQPFSGDGYRLGGDEDWDKLTTNFSMKAQSGDNPENGANFMKKLTTATLPADSACGAMKVNELGKRKQKRSVRGSHSDDNCRVSLQWDPDNERRMADHLSKWPFPLTSASSASTSKVSSMPACGGNRLGGEEEFERLKAEQAVGAQCSANLNDTAIIAKVKDETEVDNLDPDQPTTALQIRLPDNSRLSVTFNQTHNVGDVRKHIARWRPKIKPDFQLLVSYPVRKLSDNHVTLKDADLLNAALIVR